MKSLVHDLQLLYNQCVRLFSSFLPIISMEAVHLLSKVIIDKT